MMLTAGLWSGCELLLPPLLTSDPRASVPLSPMNPVASNTFWTESTTSIKFSAFKLRVRDLEWLLFNFLPFGDRGWEQVSMSSTLLALPRKELFEGVRVNLSEFDLGIGTCNEGLDCTCVSSRAALPPSSRFPPEPTDDPEANRL